MKQTQKAALEILDSMNANAIRFRSTGWIWRDDIRRRESIAEVVIRKVAEEKPEVRKD